MRPSSIFSSVCLLATASASAWKPLEALKREVAPLLPRQHTSYDLSYSGTQGNTATTITSSSDSSVATSTGTAGSTATGSDAQTTGSGASSGATTGKKATATSGSSGKSSKFTGSPTFDPRLPAGGIEMLTPAPTASSSYYKIMDYVTFAWNYTSLSITPSAIDILASCSLNSATYTLAMNASITGPTQAFTWDTNEFQQTAATTLLTGDYTLIIHDAAKDISATPQAGYLSVYSQFQFGMYTPQPYTPMADFVCATCNSAVSTVERQTMGFIVGMVVVTVTSFGWFAGVAGLW